MYFAVSVLVSTSSTVDGASTAYLELDIGGASIDVGGDLRRGGTRGERERIFFRCD